MVWKDFMGRVIQVGDDVVIAVDGQLKSGIVLEMTDELLTVPYNWFVGMKEYEQTMYYPSLIVKDGVVKSLVIINRK